MAAKLPIFNTPDKNLSLLQTSWASILNVFIGNPLVNGFVLSNLSLANGTTVINHKLGRKMQGWFITDIDGAASVYRSAPLNDLTLTLVSNAPVIASLYVF